MSKLIVLVGLPASGKSTFVSDLIHDYDAVALSSDDLREELLGDVNNQEKNTDIFEVLNKRANQLLSEGTTVIIDATNINRKRRIHLINQEIKADEYHVYFMNKTIGSCYYNDTLRDRKVGLEVIDRMYKNMHIPTLNEGWDSVTYMHNEYVSKSYYKELFEDILANDDPDHESLFEELSVVVSEFEEIYDVPHDSKYHSFSISRHIFYTYKYILDNYKGDRLLEMKVAALFHDLGKGHCKSFINFKGEESRYAAYIGHENVSAQLASYYLHQLGYDDSFIKYVVDLIQFHMKFMNMSDKTEKKLMSLLTPEQYLDLIFLHQADTNAK